MMKSKVRRSSTPLRLILFHLVLSLIAVLLIIIVLVVTTKGFADIDARLLRASHDGSASQRQTQDRVCSTAECVKISGEILSRMDTSADPCTDFYEYACGGFIRSPLIPEDSSKWGTTSVIDKTNKFVVKEILEQPIEGSKDEAVNKAKLMYVTCLNVSQETRNLDSVYKMIADIGSWPLETPHSEWREEAWNLETSLAASHKRYVRAVFLVYVSTDNRNNSINRLIFNQGANTNFFPFASFYEGPNAAKNKAALFDLILQMVRLVKGSESVARTHLEDIWQIDKALSDIKLTLQEYRADVRKRYNLMTIAELQSSIGVEHMNLNAFLELLFGRSIPSAETVIVRVPKVFSQLGLVLSSTKKSTLSTYFVLLALWKNADAISGEFRDVAEKFAAMISGGKNEVPLWQRCVASTVESLGFAVGALFTRGHFTVSDKKEVVTMLENIRQSFIHSIPSLTWMDDATKSSAVNKAQRVSHKLGFPDFIQDSSKLDASYADLIVTDDHFLNHVASFERAGGRNLQKLGQPVNDDEWSDHTSPTVVNAFYDPQKNAMIFPAGILQKPLYHPSYPRALNYGAIGTIMGHEFTHGFDTTGRRYDERGNLFNWWANASTLEFEQRTQCLVDQYNQFALDGIPMNGVLTLGENIADNGGLRLSHKAYKSWLAVNNDRQLVGLDLTHEQMFFLGQAQTLCTAIKPSYIPHIMMNDVHSPPKFRVLGTMMNMKEFSSAFNCPKSSSMNPEKKCIIWT